MEHSQFNINLDNYPGLFIVPTYTSPFPSDELTDDALKDEIEAERQRQRLLLKQSGERDLGKYVYWLADNEIRHRYAYTDDAKSMYFCERILRESFMDEYILDILADWELDEDPALAVHNLLSCAEEYSHLFSLRAACLLKAGYVCELHDKDVEAASLYLAVLSAFGKDVVAMNRRTQWAWNEPHNYEGIVWGYRDEAYECYCRVHQFAEDEPMSTASGNVNPLARSQERLLRQLLEKHGASQLADFIVAASYNAMTLEPAENQEEFIGCSKIGGLPDVPPGWTWPGQYLEFIAQINLEDLVPFDHNKVLPPRGLLSFFARNLCYSTNDDETDLTVTLYEGNFADLRPAKAPAGYGLFGEIPHPGSDLTVYGSLVVTPKPAISMPHFGEHRLLPETDSHHELSDALENTMNDIRGDVTRHYHGKTHHQVLGHGSSDDYFNECVASRSDSGKGKPQIDTGKYWDLLLQIDSDDRVGMLFNDAGTRFFMITPEDLAARRFERCRVHHFSG